MRVIETRGLAKVFGKGESSVEALVGMDLDAPTPGRQPGDILRRMIGAPEDDQSTRKKGDDRARNEGVE